MKNIQFRVEVCKQQVRLQNYQRHLKLNHPDEDSRDLRGYGVRKFSWGKVSSPESRDLTLQEDEDVPDGDDLACLPPSVEDYSKPIKCTPSSLS